MKIENEQVSEAKKLRTEDGSDGLDNPTVYSNLEVDKNFLYSIDRPENSSKNQNAARGRQTTTTKNHTASK